MGNWCFSPRNPWSSFTLRKYYVGLVFGGPTLAGCDIIPKKPRPFLLPPNRSHPTDFHPNQQIHPSNPSNEPVFEAACSHQQVVVRLEQCMDHRYHLMVPFCAKWAGYWLQPWVNPLGCFGFFLSTGGVSGEKPEQGEKNTHEYLRRKR